MPTATYQERMATHELRARTAKLARTYLRKVSSLLYSDDRIPMTSWNRDVMDEALDVVKEIVEHLPDDYFESSPVEDAFGLLAAAGIKAEGKFNSSDDTLEKAQAVVAAIEKRRGNADRLRLIAALENTTGRTPEEAEMYLARAAELRREDGDG